MAPAGAAVTWWGLAWAGCPAWLTHMAGAGDWASAGSSAELCQAVYTRALPVAWASQHDGGVPRGSLPEGKSSQMQEAEAPGAP